MEESNRSPLMYVGTHGTDDPTLASMPFMVATGAGSAEIDCCVVLMGEAASLVKPGMIESVHGVGFPSLSELAKKVKDFEIPVYVRGACAVARGVTEEDLKVLGASFTDPVGFSEMAAERSVVSY